MRRPSDGSTGRGDASLPPAPHAARAASRSRSRSRVKSSRRRRCESKETTAIEVLPRARLGREQLLETRPHPHVAAHPRGMQARLHEDDDQLLRRLRVQTREGQRFGRHADGRRDARGNPVDRLDGHLPPADADAEIGRSQTLDGVTLRRQHPHLEGQSADLDRLAIGLLRRGSASEERGSEQCDDAPTGVHAPMLAASRRSQQVPATWQRIGSQGTWRPCDRPRR